MAEAVRKADAEEDSKSGRTRARILDAAAFAFRRNGFATVTLKQIATLAGMKAGSLYYHFDSKEALVREVLETGVQRAFAATREAVEALGSGADPLARLRTAIAAHIRAMLKEGDYASANLRILGQVPEEIRNDHLRLQRAYGNFWRGLFEEAAAAGLIRDDLDLSVVRMLTLGALNWTTEWYREDEGSPAEIAAHASTMILDGLRGRTRAEGRSSRGDPARRTSRRFSDRG